MVAGGCDPEAEVGSDGGGGSGSWKSSCQGGGPGAVMPFAKRPELQTLPISFVSYKTSYIQAVHTDEDPCNGRLCS